MPTQVYEYDIANAFRLGISFGNCVRLPAPADAGDPCVVHEDCVGEQQFCNDFTLECEIGDVAAVATQTDSGSSSSVSSSGSSSSNSIIHIGRRDASTSTDHKEPERGVSEKTVTFSQTQTSVSSANDDINIEPAKCKYWNRCL